MSEYRKQEPDGDEEYWDAAQRHADEEAATQAAAAHDAQPATPTTIPDNCPF